jgi:hypothetical protein
MWGWCYGILQAKRSLMQLPKLIIEVSRLIFRILLIHLSTSKSVVKCSISLGAQACVLCFSTVDRESYDAIEQWMAKVWIGTMKWYFLLAKERKLQKLCSGCVCICYCLTGILYCRSQKNVVQYLVYLYKIKLILLTKLWFNRKFAWRRLVIIIEFGLVLVRFVHPNLSIFQGWGRNTG